MRALVKPLGGSGVKNSGIPKVQQVPVPTIGKESLPTTDVSAPETTAGSGKTFLQKLGDVLSYNQKMDTASSAMAMGALLGNKQLQSTGTQLGQSATENYVDSAKEFGYITERGAGGAAQSAQGVVNALGYLGQHGLQAQALQTAGQYEALGNLTGIDKYKGVSESFGGIAQDLQSKGLQDTAKFGTKYQQSIQERYADANITKTGKALGDVSETVGGLAPSAVMNVIAPGSGIVVSALSAGGNATQEALANGASDHEALAYGAAVGTIEAATEKIFDGMAGLFGKGAADDVIASMAKKLAKREGAQNAVVKIANSLGEGVEEFISEVSTRVVNELIVDTDDRSFLQTLGDAGYSLVMGSVLSGIVQTADGVTRAVKADPKGLAQQAANATLANIKGQAAAQRIDSMRQQLMDMQHRKKLDELAAVYEKNVPNANTQFSTNSHMKRTIMEENADVQGILEMAKKNGKIELTEDMEDAIARKSFSEIEELKEKLPDRAVRKWYLAHDSTILQEVDQNGNLEQRARQAFELRNINREHARDLMENQEKRVELDRSDPNKTFEELISDKMRRKGLTREEALQDILNTAGKTRASVNKMFGLGE